MSRLVPEPSAPPTMSALGDPLSQAEKFVVEIFEDTALWEAIDESKVPSKKEFGPRAIVYGGWFPTCADWSFVCVYGERWCQFVAPGYPKEYQQTTHDPSSLRDALG